MKKIFLNELEIDKRNDLIRKNTKLMTQLQNDLYESNMDMQYMDSKYIMDDEALRAIEYHDNYDSFFYTLLDWRKFITHIDSAYLSDEAGKIYNYIMDKLDTLDSMDCYSENYNNLEEHLEEKTKEVLKDIEDYLHTYEEYPDEDDAIEYAWEMGWLDDYYIEEQEDGSTDGVIRQDIAYTETYI